MIPCQLCPRNSFAGPPTVGGFRQCILCPEGTFTARLGAVGPSQCSEPCAPGQFSVSGLQPCSPCPANLYQPSFGQQRCIECANDSFTSRAGATEAAQCTPVDCAAIRCQNSGECAVVQHVVQCKCLPGFAGLLCETNLDACAQEPCFSGATCQDDEEG
jgi:hypothetical protein